MEILCVYLKTGFKICLQRFQECFLSSNGNILVYISPNFKLALERQVIKARSQENQNETKFYDLLLKWQNFVFERIGLGALLVIIF